MPPASSGGYVVAPAREEREVAGCIEVLEHVRRDELNRAGASAVQSDVFEGVEVDYLLLACREADSGSVVGCIRLTPASNLASIGSVRAEYRLDLFGGRLLERSLLMTRLALLPEHRRTLASLDLYRGIREYFLRSGYEMGLLSCEPNLLPLYQSLGGRVYGRVHRGSRGGLRVPMVFLFHDQAHFQAIDSPIADVGGSTDFEARRDGIDWYDGLLREEGAIDVGIQSFSDRRNPSHGLLTRDLSDEGIEELLKNCLIVRPERHDVIVAEHDGGKSAGFVVRGLVEARANSQTVALLGPGEVFGEMASVLRTKRTASLLAATDDTEIGILSQRCFERLSNPQDREQVWRNLAEILARKLLAAQATQARPRPPARDLRA